MTATIIRVKGRYEATLRFEKWIPVADYRTTDERYDYEIEDLNHDLAVHIPTGYDPWPEQTLVERAQQFYPGQVEVLSLTERPERIPGRIY